MVTSLLSAIVSSVSTFALTIVSAADEDAATVQTADMAAVGSFLVIGLITLATIFLIFDMIRRMRRTKYRELVRAEIAAELAAQDAQAGQSSKSSKLPQSAKIPQSSKLPGTKKIGKSRQAGTTGKAASADTQD